MNELLCERVFIAKKEGAKAIQHYFISSFASHTSDSLQIDN